MTIWIPVRNVGVSRTVHCCLCMNCYRTGWVSVCVCSGGEAVGVTIPSLPLLAGLFMRRRQWIFLHILHGIRYLRYAPSSCLKSWEKCWKRRVNPYLLNMCKKSRKIFVSLWKKIREHIIKAKIRQTGTLGYQSSPSVQGDNNISDPSEISTVWFRLVSWNFFQKTPI
jgi:hypothetical protein